MFDIRAGRALRLLRRRLGLTQAELARRAGVSQGTVSLAEAGHLDRLALRTIRSFFAAVDASFDGVVGWRGGQLDRLLDARHARIVERMATMLQADGWEVAAEVSFNVYGDRGSIDLLAVHSPEHVALVVEVKSELTAIEETLRRLDVKLRVASGVVRTRFGWAPSAVSAVLVLPDRTAIRDRVRAHSATFDASLPARTVAMRHWLAAPTAGTRVAGILFLRDTNPGGAASGRGRRGRLRKP